MDFRQALNGTKMAAASVEGEWFMTRTRPLRRSDSVVTLMVAAVISAFCQQQAPSTDEGTKTEAVQLYAGAHPYIDESVPDLKKSGRELAGLKPDPSQLPLSELLTKVGAKADQLLQQIPDLISDEVVSQMQYSMSEIVPGCVGTVCGGVGKTFSRDQTFNYLILTHPAHDGRLVLQEYRMSRKGNPVQQADGEPIFQGFISAWIVFSSKNQVESRFRYLGQQQTDGYSTFVIGFAQIPSLVESPGLMMTGREAAPMLLQGIAWIDQSNFRIVRLRTDLLAPQPEIQVHKQMANILFGPARIAGLDLELWLPQAVHVEMEARGQFFQEQHKYSKYRLYQVKSKIMMSPSR